MKNTVNRRAFLGASVAALASASLPLVAAAAEESSATTGASATKQGDPKLLKALKYTMLPEKLSDEEKFRLAKRCGFDGIDGNPTEDLEAARKQAELARKIGVPFHGLVYGGWQAPLSDPDPQVTAKGVEGMKTALRCANAMGCETVLLVPAIVNDKVGYGDAYRRSQENVRKLIPLAEEMKVTIAIENVWNKFLLSPLEFARYIDEFNSPWVKAYFDVGNVILFGFSEDWIRTLGKRIVRMDVKDFRRKGYEWVNLGEGDVNWPEVRKAMQEIGYNGWITAEVSSGDEAYLTNLAKRMEGISRGEVKA